MRTRLLSLAAALCLATAIPQTSATEEPTDDEHFDGGNAMDNLLYIAATPFHFLPREFWMTKYMLGTIEGRILLYRYWVLRTSYYYWWARPTEPRAGSAPAADTPGDTPADNPLGVDAPAESVLDQMDESDAQLPMVGMPGTQSQSLDAMGAIPTPPPESILDFIDESPNPAVNQATPPKVVEAPR